MKEKIYTIPINEAFDQDTECPICICEQRLEKDALEYSIGPAMMEPDNRIETNRTGFCPSHYAKLYNLHKDRLPLALIIDTHMAEQITILEDLYKKHEDKIESLRGKSLPAKAMDAVLGKKNAAEKALTELLEKLNALKSTCAVCIRVDKNMDQLIDNTLYLYRKEENFRKKFLKSKGFCLKHLESILKKAMDVFPPSRQAEFLTELIPMELGQLKRVREEVNHFTKMFDYRNAEGDWKNSRDAVPRSIEKLSGICGLMR